MRRSMILSTAAVALALGTSAATAQQPPAVQPPVQAPQAVAPQPQVVWTPTYYYDATGALWLVYVPSAPANVPSAPANAAAATRTTTQAVGPVRPNQPAAQAPGSLVSPSNREQGTGRDVRMHKPWMKGRR